MNIRGIGEWSAYLILIRGLGRMEEFSEHDQILLNCIRKFYSYKTTVEQIREVVAGYEHFKGYWAYYLRTV